MKKNYLKKLLAVCVIAALCISTTLITTFAAGGASGKPESTSKWRTEIVDFGATTKGLQINIDKENACVTYTIPEGFTGDINLCPVADAMEILEGTYLPGSVAPFAVKIVNNSGVKYEYIENSFSVSTEDCTPYIEQGVAEAPADKNTVGFDGSPIPTGKNGYTTRRTKNTAIQALYGVTSTSKVTDAQVTDEALGDKLREAGYNGIEELSKYFLDFYNAKHEGKITPASRLEDFPNSVIREMFSGNVNKSNIFESSKECAELGYNWFYNHLISFAPTSTGYPGNNNDAYTIGAYMRASEQGIAGPYEEFCKTAFGSIEDGAYSLEPFELWFNGPDTVNVYQSYNLGFFMGFKLRQVTGDLTVNKVDADSNKIDAPASFVLTKEIDGKTCYYSEDGSFVETRQNAKTFVTENGSFSVPALAFGTYHLLETEAPEGYIQNTQPIEVVVDQKTVSIDVLNDAKPVYHVFYDANGGTGTQNDENAYYEGDDAAALGQGGIVNEGFLFDGWNTKPDGTGTSYNEGDSFTMPAGDVTLYAQWMSEIVDIPDDDTPLGPKPNQPETPETPDKPSNPSTPNKPSTTPDGTVTIPDDDVPLGSAPQTGDSPVLPALAVLALGAGLTTAALLRKKK